MFAHDVLLLYDKTGEAEIPNGVENQIVATILCVTVKLLRCQNTVILLS